VNGITLEQFKRHATKFGPECVLETARGHLSERELAELELDAEPKRGRHRRTTRALESQVLELARRGLVRAAIADQLNIGDRRVREILANSPTPVFGGRKPFAQAELFAS
jgi:DNA-binding NarL/FixJ family response regulator